MAGSGKTTIGTLLAERLGLQYADADEFHTETSRRKMAAGEPLTDAERRPWLAAIAAWIDERLGAGESGVVSCSALKREYRRLLHRGRLVFLDVDPAVIRERLAHRVGHFFPADLAASQFEALDPPTPDENVLVVDGNQPPSQVVDEIVAGL